MLDSLSSLSESVVHGVARWAWRNWKGLVAAAAAAYIVNRAVVASRQVWISNQHYVFHTKLMC